MLFILPLKRIFCSQDFYFFALTFYVMWKNGLIQKIRLVSKNFNLTNWLTNYYNTHIALYLKKQRHLGNEIWSVNRI